MGVGSSEAKLMAMHSRCYTDIILKPSTGLLKADANAPFQALAGFKGDLLGKSTYEIDNISKGDDVTVTDSASATQKYVTRKVFVMKPNPFIFVLKQGAKAEDARDILGRIDYQAITQWYTFYPLHKQIDPMDIRAAGLVYLTKERTT